MTDPTTASTSTKPAQDTPERTQPHPSHRRSEPRSPQLGVTDAEVVHELADVSR
jgi:hypothetical protein